eukprot:Rhum_TRINITY_DN13226_c0_g1::Rhum_TRINITY_DN13226_c0_g1_i1::g.57918::m.57918
MAKAQQWLVLSLALLQSVDAFMKFENGVAVSPAGHVDAHHFHYTGLCSADTLVNGATMVIEEGRDYYYDTLRCPCCSSLGISSSYDRGTSSLTLTGTKSIEAYAEALACSEFETTSWSSSPRTITWTIGTAKYSSETGHYYEMKTLPQRGITSWSEAQTLCAAKSNDMLGLVGYLATIDGDAERLFIKSKVPPASWYGYAYLGGTDMGSEQQWKWVTGPEGCPDSYDLSIDGPTRSACDVGFPVPETTNPCGGTECDKGTAISSNLWASGQPNEGGSYCPSSASCVASGQDYVAMTYRSSYLGDFEYNYPSMSHYVCEYGGIGELCIAEDDMTGHVTLQASCSRFYYSSSCVGALPAGSCSWTPQGQWWGICEEAGCYANHDSSSCLADPSCDWYTTYSPAQCQPGYCQSHYQTEAACAEDALYPCHWYAGVAAPNQCQRLSCEKITNQCECWSQKKHCFWDGACKTLTAGNGCSVHGNEATCKSDKLCNWNVNYEHHCYADICVEHCDQATCEAHMCMWSSGQCHKDTTDCSLLPEADCKLKASCLWNPFWALGACTENVCLHMHDFMSCQSVEITVPSPHCNVVQGGGDPDFCQMSPCVFSTTHAIPCHTKKCQHITDATCTADPLCDWVGPAPAGSSPTDTVVFCREKLCQYPSEVACEMDVQERCTWNSATASCEPKPCVPFVTEWDCTEDHLCKWDTKKEPASCTITECGLFGKDACVASDKCMWDLSPSGTNRGPLCKSLNCRELIGPCSCYENPQCEWNNDLKACMEIRYTTCPDLDIGFMIDGSGSMKRSFGSHPHGFYGLITILKNWVSTIPLTGDAYTVKGGTVSKGTGFRISFIQFSKAEPGPNEDRPAESSCPVGVCAAGHLSGDLNELNGDLDWQRDHYQNWWTYLHAALEDVAENTFDPIHSPPWRRHIVIIVADGGLTDVDGRACSVNQGNCPTWKDNLYQNVYRTRLNTAYEKLIADGVTVFGIVMRRFSYDTEYDVDARQKLEPLVTEPNDEHFMSLEMDEITSEVLTALCDPTSKFGKVVVPVANLTHLPCPSWGAQDECNADGDCEWQTPGLTTCDDAHGEHACPAMNCLPVPHVYRSLYGCANCRLIRTVITCGAHIVGGSIGGTCQATHCHHCCNETCCDDDTRCTWDTRENQCDRKVCEHTDTTACLADPDHICEWNATAVPPTCQLKFCEATFVEAQCDAKEGCEWDTNFDPPICVKDNVCPTLGEAACLLDTTCHFNCTSATCAQSQCLFSTELECSSQPKCHWTATGCDERPCFLQDQTTCEASCETCKWDTTTTPAHCRPDLCTPLDQAACGTADACEWVGGVCVEDYCAQYEDNAGACGSDPRCEYKIDVSPAECVKTDCTTQHGGTPTHPIDAAACTADSNCQTGSDSTGDFCEPTTCGDLTTACECTKRDPACFWDNEAGTCLPSTSAMCPNMDIVFAVDGGASLFGPYGPYPRGFDGLMESIRSFSRVASLTGDATGTADGTRIGIVQFSSPTDAWMCKDGCTGTGCTASTPATPCSQGLSGIEAEINSDIDWHEKNVQMATETYLPHALDKAAAVFGGSPAGRKKVLIVITDGELLPTSQGSAVTTSMAKLTGVETFGVVVRKTATKTTAEQRAEGTLTPLVGAPEAEHFVALPLTELLNTVLDTMCVPGGVFGKAITAGTTTTSTALPCVNWGTELSCRADPSCAWDTQLPTCTTGCVNLNCKELTPTQLANGFTCANCRLHAGFVQCDAGATYTASGTCKASPCEEACDEPTCQATAPVGDCAWNPDRCEVVQCDYSDSVACENDILCFWNTTADPDTCDVKECLHFAQGTCNADGQCNWDVDTETCVPIQPDCDSLTNADTCIAHPSGACEWDCGSGKCVNRECSQHTYKTACEGDTKCLWDTESNLCHKVHCTANTQADCIADTMCIWDGTCKGKDDCYHHASEFKCESDQKCQFSVVNCGICEPRPCADSYSTSADCEADPLSLNCQWDSATGVCVDQKCDDYNGLASGTACPCKADPRCEFDTSVTPAQCKKAEYENCPDLDLMVAVDRTCNTGKYFGVHPSGYDAMLEQVRDFVRIAPMTGEAAGATSTSTSGSLRVSVAGFADTVTVGDCATCSCGGSTLPLGAGTTTCGKFSGQRSQIDADLAALQEQQPATACTGNLANVARFAKDSFDVAPVARTRVLLVLQSGEGNYDNLATLRTQLIGRGIRVFGFKVTKTATATTADSAIKQNMVTNLVTTPDSATSVMGDVAELYNQLHLFCKPEGSFGSVVTQGLTSTPQVKACSTYGTIDLCNANNICEWSSISSSCLDHPCYPHCDEPVCTADTVNQCTWDATTHTCHKTICEEILLQTDCEANSDCDYDPTRTPACQEKECLANTEADCQLHGAGCKWVLTPAPATCTPVPCFASNSTACLAEPGCEWTDACPGTEACIEEPCKSASHATLAGCQADVKCVWSAASVCERKPCTEYTEEACCGSDSQCLWDTSTSPAGCAQKYCPKTYPTPTQNTACDDDSKCMFNTTSNTCVDKNCREFEECRCRSDPTCFYLHAPGTTPACRNAEFGMCPTMDIVVMVSGGSTLGGSFGRHPNGFTAVNEMLKDWSARLPLTTEVGGEELASAIGVRVGIVQFAGVGSGGSKTPLARVSAGTGSAGRLTGDAAQFDADLLYQEQNHFDEKNMLSKGLEEAANMFSPTHALNGRKRVLLIITEEKPKDSGLMGPALTTLQDEGVEIFSVVLRKGASSKNKDKDAETAMRAIVSSAADDHVANLDIEDFEATILDTLCQPTGAFGKSLVVTPSSSGVHFPCATYAADAQACSRDPGCVFSSTLSTCVDSPCTAHCEEVACTADTVNLCAWNATTGDCVKETLCSHTDQSTCEADVHGCVWNTTTTPPTCEERPCSFTTLDDCENSGERCVWDPVATPFQCLPEPCIHDNVGECTADPLCRWTTSACDGTTTYCEPIPCVNGATSPLCLADPKCQWTGTACEEQPCAKYSQEKCCADYEACKWSVNVNPSTCTQEPCLLIDGQTNCAADASCLFGPNATGTDKCLPLECSKLTTEGRCPCNANVNCYWKPTAAGGQCVDTSFGVCPTMDIVVLVDGASSMKGSFGGHPNGYDAMIELLKKWATSLPLNGEDSDLGLGSVANNEGVRVGFVQYGASLGATPTALAKGAPFGGTYGTGGRLSGKYEELDWDLNWHEENFYDAGLMLEEGYKKAAAMFAGSPSDGRTKLLLVFTDGPIADSTAMAGPLTTLSGLGVKTFGVVVRKGATNTQVDSDAEADLKPLVTPTGQDHVVNLEIDQVQTFLGEMCSPSGRWGTFIVTQAPQPTSGVHNPCPDYDAKSPCEADLGCVWSEVGVACEDHPCLKLCEEPVCTAASASFNCSWNATDASCFKEPVPVCTCKYNHTDVMYNERECKENPVCMWDAPNTECLYDECQGTNNSCSAIGQTCDDPNKEPCTQGDWVCTCPPPSVGTQVGGVASCTIDECTATCDTCAGSNCTAGLQLCNDPDKDAASLGDWTCTCIPPATGVAVGNTATCVLDECAVAGCPTCANTTCSVGEQTCLDVNTSALSQSDWICACPPPSDATAVGKLADCSFDECTLYGETCTNSSQTCTDPDLLVNHDWICVCVDPLSGNATAQVSQCRVDECAKVCDTCANTTCSAVGQTCEDLDHSSLHTSDWTCTCPPPSTGVSTANAAVCVLNECTTVGCATCANTTCSAGSQTCLDPNPLASSTGDWVCVCPPPATANATGGLADCSIDECENHGVTCVDADQTCNDPNGLVQGDWMCICVAPAAGNATASVANCTLDECEVQNCATCANSTCADAGQTCVDADISGDSLNSWTCICPFPSTGNATANAAQCSLDECEYDGCATCANTTCSAGGQTCNDPLPLMSSVNDWICACP